MTTTTVEQIHQLGQRWAEAEQRGDTDTLADLATDDFILIGPVGFVLDRDQWLARYRPGGGLVTHSLTWTDITVRDYADTAIAIGTHTQQASYHDNPVNGQFRATHIAVRRNGRWLLAGIHLSPIGGRN